MRKISLIILSTFIAFCAYAQKVVITEPASIAGAYTFGTGFGAILTDSIWCGDIILMDDGTDPNTDGCEQTTNDYSGKIVMIDRGACEFGVKALQAEMAGAIAVIIVNNVDLGGALGLGPGASGGQVSIPTISLSLADGNIIKPVLASEPVNICIGFKIYDNDLSTATGNSANVLFPFRGTLTSDQMGVDSAYVYTPVVRVINSGQEDQPNVVTQVKINFDGSEVYNESITLGVIEEDSTGFLVFPDYLFVDDTPGAYLVEVSTASDSTDQDLSDNEASRGVTVLGNGAAARCSWDVANNLPTETLLTTIGSTTDDQSIEFFQGIDFPLGGVTIDSFTTTIRNGEAGATSLDGNTVLFSLYEWDDENGDFIFTDGEFSTVGLRNSAFDASSGIEERVMFPFFNTDPYAPQDLAEKIIVEADKNYVFGEKYLGENAVSFAFDGSYPNFFAFGLTGISYSDFPYSFTNTFVNGESQLGAEVGIFTNFGNSLSVGYYTSPIVSSVDEVELKGSINLYPNPASDELWAEINLEEVSSELILAVYSSTGRILSSRTVENAKEERLRYDTTRLTSGSYYIRVRSENQVKVIPFVIVK